MRFHGFSPIFVGVITQILSGKMYGMLSILFALHCYPNGNIRKVASGFVSIQPPVSTCYNIFYMIISEDTIPNKDEGEIRQHVCDRLLIDVRKAYPGTCFMCVCQCTYQCLNIITKVHSHSLGTPSVYVPTCITHEQEFYFSLAVIYCSHSYKFTLVKKLVGNYLH